MVAPVTRQQTVPHDDSGPPCTAGPLATLDADARAALRAVTRRLGLARGAHVWGATDVPEAVYLVVEGDVRIVSVAGRGREATVALL